MSTNQTGDHLDLIAQLAVELAYEVSAEHAPDRLGEPDPRYEMLDRAWTMLMQSARHVPVAVDEILEMALAQGGYHP
ncbi:hypothetical protein [Methylobacterium nonmethylotrophicum]|uniref:Uncharacterized protein n=1 Tax=Methylobacterium nonmethylotrophicum TaxID=1141884 RepID=A0A4Z0NFJ3_9HYPH|nr:hypothetical protein [Methylobacterium nonmethylotrophicum]TGD93723.1 hypothetical protein EU555_33075 [Methylobacterium nonmethylotrophicum]